MLLSPLVNIANSYPLYSLQDYNEDGKLSFSEFSDLINAFGNQQAATKVWTLFVFGSNSLHMFSLVVVIKFKLRVRLDTVEN